MGYALNRAMRLEHGCDITKKSLRPDPHHPQPVAAS
jgi:hypothetical protein